MPTYEYICPNGHSHDDRRSVDDRERSGTCPECGELAAYKPSFTTAFLLPYNPSAETQDQWPSADLRNHRDAVKQYEKFQETMKKKRGSSEEVPE